MKNLNEGMIERLRTSKQTALAQAYADGQSCGRNWAETKAEWVELTRLVKVRDEQRQWNNWEHFFGGNDSVWSAGETLHQVLMGGDELYGNPNRQEAAEFWESLGVSEEAQGDGRFMQGFADGAVELFETAKAHL